MSGAKIKQLREAVRTMIGRLEPTDTVSIIVFNAHSDVLIPATAAENKAALLERVGRLEAGGGTTMAPAMRAGLAEIAKNLSPRVASPVSYTHLDVYKRQVWQGADRRPQRPLRPGGDAPLPVDRPRPGRRAVQIPTGATIEPGCTGRTGGRCGAGGGHQRLSLIHI